VLTGIRQLRRVAPLVTRLGAVGGHAFRIDDEPPPTLALTHIGKLEPCYDTSRRQFFDAQVASNIPHQKRWICVVPKAGPRAPAPANEADTRHRDGRAEVGAFGIHRTVAIQGLAIPAHGRYRRDLRGSRCSEKSGEGLQGSYSTITIGDFRGDSFESSTDSVNRLGIRDYLLRQGGLYLRIRVTFNATGYRITDMKGNVIGDGRPSASSSASHARIRGPRHHHVVPSVAGQGTDEDVGITRRNPSSLTLVPGAHRQISRGTFAPRPPPPHMGERHFDFALRST
jgi:hypothetical protein